MARAPVKRSAKRDGLFLGHLTATGNVSASARVAGYQRRTLYGWREQDAEFKAAWEDAAEQGVDGLEEEARRRAHDGVEEPVFYRGEKVGAVRKYSDLLLIFLLKGHRPEKYRERSEQVVKGKVEHAHTVDLSLLTDDELADLERLRRNIDARRDTGAVGEEATSTIH